jgi:hypothetical protein
MDRSVGITLVGLVLDEWWMTTILSVLPPRSIPNYQSETQKKKKKEKKA